MVLEGQRLFLTRLATGLAQGLVLYALYHAQSTQSWPATNGLVFGPLLMAWLYPPLLLILSLGQAEWRKAMLWTAAAAVLIAGLAAYDVWSAWPQDWVFSAKSEWRPHIMSSVQLVLFGGAGLFIAYVLVIGGHLDRRFKATYETHFDVAWKLAVQLALAALFVGAFWLLLWLGAGLFNLIKLDFFQKLIRHDWFAIPISALATAGSLHLTDIRPALVRGARTLLLTLLSWLLLVSAVISAGFLLSLCFTGLKPLWSTNRASALLLIDAAALIILTNAAYQDGHAERLPPKLLRYSGTAAAFLIVPLAALACYALFLRVQQYGWSAGRVTEAATLVVASGYAIGYAWAATGRDMWLKRIEDWNFGIALLILAVLMVLFTPIAKPERIAVADQMARLESGKTAPAKFDFAYLRRQGGRYGMAALETLSKDGNSFLRDQAVGYLKQVNPFGAPLAPPAALAARIHVYPEGSKLPDDFVQTKWGINPRGVRPACMMASPVQCDAFMLDLDGDGKSEILLIAQNSTVAAVYRKSDEGVWEDAAYMSIPFRCQSIISALKQGHFELVPEPHPWKQINVAGVALPLRDNHPALLTCPP